jgi:hypothetical protein
MVEIGVDKNSTIVFPAPLMSTIGELGTFLTRETSAAGDILTRPGPATNGKDAHVKSSAGSARDDAA